MFTAAGAASAQTAATNTTTILPNRIMLAPELKVTINSGPAPTTDNFQLPPGYHIQPVLWNLTLPSSVTFDEKGTMYVAEAGYSDGGIFTQPRILKVDKNGTISVLNDRGLFPLITDIVYPDGLLYVSNRDKISTVDPWSGIVKDIIIGLPSIGDHHNDQIVFGSDGRLYFGQGTATNSAVVGEDNFIFGWPKLAPQFHDIAGMNITLTGKNFETSNPLSSNPNDRVKTGTFVPFGTETKPG